MTYFKPNSTINLWNNKEPDFKWLKKILINGGLFIALYLICVFIYSHYNDETMKFKHWISLFWLEIVMQIIIERSFRKKE